MDWGAPPVINNDEMAALVTEAAKEVVGEEDVFSSCLFQFGLQPVTFFILTSLLQFLQ